jgi:hypothetical protein
MSFWSSSDKIPVRQTKVSIPAENGLNFNDGGLLHITIPPTVKFFQPKESYLEWEVDLTSSQPSFPTRLQLDEKLGSQVLIRDIRIYSGGAGGVLLEEIQNYNVLTRVKYDYETDDTIKGKRAMTEGATIYSNACRGTRQTFKSDLNNVNCNPYFQPYTYGLEQTQATESFEDAYNTGAAGGVNPGQQRVKCLLPLNTGIFSNDKVFPAMLTDGLRVEILLEDAAKCLRQLDTVNLNRSVRLGPIFHSINGEDDDLTAADSIWANGKATTTLFVKRDNNQIDLSNFPLVVGERITLAKNTVDLATEQDTQMVANLTGAGNNYAEIDKIDWAPGDEAAGDTTEGGYWGLVKITLTEAMTNATGEDITGQRGDWTIVSESVCPTLNRGAYSGWTTPSYTVANVNLILQQLEMPPAYVSRMLQMMKEGGTINYDFLSATNYKYSQVSSDVVANIRLPLSQTRAKGILSVPTDASVYQAYQQITGGNGQHGQFQNDGKTAAALATQNTAMTYIEVPGDKRTDALIKEGYGDQAIASVSSGITGIWDYLTQYQWFYNGHLNPSRPIQCGSVSRKTSVQQQPVIELEKALAVCGIRPHSFRSLWNNAVIGRALSLQNGTYNTVGKDFNLQVEYTDTDYAPCKNKLWHNFVHHIRRIVIKNTDIALEI